MCKHDWAEISKTLMPSPLDRLKNRKFEVEEPGIEFFKQKLVVIAACTKCGKIKKFVESNP